MPGETSSEESGGEHGFASIIVAEAMLANVQTLVTCSLMCWYNEVCGHSLTRLGGLLHFPSLQRSALKTRLGLSTREHSGIGEILEAATYLVGLIEIISHFVFFFALSSRFRQAVLGYLPGMARAEPGLGEWCSGQSRAGLG